MYFSFNWTYFETSVDSYEAVRNNGIYSLPSFSQCLTPSKTTFRMLTLIQSKYRVSPSSQRSFHRHNHLLLLHTHNPWSWPLATTNVLHFIICPFQKCYINEINHSLCDHWKLASFMQNNSSEIQPIFFCIIPSYYWVGFHGMYVP